MSNFIVSNFLISRYFSLLFQLYFLASVRLKALCKMLNLTESDTQKIWTNLENSIIHHTRALLMDRHLDQLIMCAIYVVCKVSDNYILYLYSVILKLIYIFVNCTVYILVHIWNYCLNFLHFKYWFVSIWTRWILLAKKIET